MAKVWRDRHEMILADGGVLYDVYASGEIRVFTDPHRHPIVTRIARLHEDFPNASANDLRKLRAAVDRLRQRGRGRDDPPLV